MIAEGHLLRKIISIIFYGLLLTMIYSCASLNAPLVFRAKASSIIPPTNGEVVSIWALDSLAPNEGIVLVRRHKIFISIYFEAHGEGNYLVQLSANGKNFKPLPYTLLKGGKTDLAVHIGWSIKPKRKIENISIALYRIEKSNSNKTEVCTLIKQIRREYDVKRHIIAAISK